MDSTNYFIMHKSGRRVHVTVLGYKHTRAQQSQMLACLAKAEHHQPKQYAIAPGTRTIALNLHHGRDFDAAEL